MAKGPSGRIVVEVSPDLKAELYVALGEEGLTLKDWLSREAERFIRTHREPSLFGPEDQPAQPRKLRSRE